MKIYIVNDHEFESQTDAAQYAGEVGAFLIEVKTI